MTRLCRSALALLIASAAALFAQEESPRVEMNGDPPPSKVGRWETVVPEDNGGAIREVLGMQTVHAALLPSGRIVLASGSSWRNLGPIKTFPDFSPPPTPEGIFKKDEDPFAMEKLEWYYQLVNNAAIYDPEKNTFFRIPHPVPQPDPDDPEHHFMPSDLFCTGEHHLPNGDLLVVGGTQYYFPFRTGHNSSFIFDWKKELKIHWETVDWRQIPDEETNPWTFAGFMKRGRWYPSLVPLLDGRFVVFGGYVGFDKDSPFPMYRFQLNHFVEIFDPAAFTKSAPQNAWKWIDVHTYPNSPFVTVINPNFDASNCATGITREDCVYTNQRDNFKLYPENYLLPDGRIYLTREGDWVSLRTPNTAFMRRTKHTYYVRVGERDNPTIRFQPGPDRPEDVTSYGTSLWDPNTGKITILGGQPTSAGTLFPFNSVPYENARMPYQFAGGRGSRKREVFHPSATEPLGGRWTLEPDFLGTAPQDDRTMHYAIILPTRQILVINGGNYDFYGGVYYPLLLTPTFKGSEFTGYVKERMSEAQQPRLYHNVAMLLPDGRIWTSGGNTSRATVYSAPVPPEQRSFPTGQPKPDLKLVDVDNYFYDDGPIGKFQKGVVQVPTEDWVAEIYSPPYLFIDPNRRAAVTDIKPARSVPYTPVEQLDGKSYYLFHSNLPYEISLEGLPDCGTGNGLLSLIKLPSPTHGWDGGQKFIELPFRVLKPNQIGVTTPDAKKANLPPAFYMLFYTDCRGKPSVARMVRFDDAAKRPLE